MAKIPIKIKDDSELTIKYDDYLGMYVLYLDGNGIMKNKKRSILATKLAKWLKSQGQ